MLTHGFNRTMKSAVLFSVDLDFRPIVEALVRHGVFVPEVWYRRTSIAAELPGAADFGHEMRFRQVYSLSTESFQRKNRIPDDDRRPDANTRSGPLMRSESLTGWEWPVELSGSSLTPPRPVSRSDPD